MTTEGATLFTEQSPEPQAGSANNAARRSATGELGPKGETVVGVVIAEDNPGVREGLVAMLNSTPGLLVVGECEDGDEVLAVVERTQPDVIAMDVGMPRMDGLEATRQLLAARPTSRVLILTASLTTALVREARDAGAAGYQLKGDDPAELVEAIRAVAHGGTGWSRQASAHLTRP